MQPGGNSPLLPRPKRVRPAAYLFPVCAEEEPPVQPRSLCLEPGFKSSSFHWCPLLREGLKLTWKKALAFIVFLAG